MATATKQLYVALDEASRPRITVDQSWVVKRRMNYAQARRHLNEAGLQKVLAGNDVAFTERDQSHPALMAMFS